MRPHMLMIGVLASGPVLGLLIGMSVNRGLAPPPEPAQEQAGRSARPDPIFTEHRAPADPVTAIPQRLAAAIAANRVPTWKRRPPERPATAVDDGLEAEVHPAGELRETFGDRTPPITGNARAATTAVQQDAARTIRITPAEVL